MTGRLDRVRDRLAALTGMAAMTARQDEDRTYLDELARAHDTTAQVASHASAVAAEAASAAVGAAEEAQRARADAAGRRELLDELHSQHLALERLRRAQQVLFTMRWLEHAPPDDATKVSIVLPTRDRATLLPGAIDSVITQTHRNWELIVVDDGSTDETPEVLARHTDERIVAVDGEGRGACSARNIGLDHATGDLVTYLDDDNRLDRVWCQGIVWAFAQHPGHDVLYGARLIDSLDRVLARSTPTSLGAMPEIQFEPFDRPTLEDGNFIDMGTVAHRRSVAARFDEDLWWFGDWDLVLQLTEQEPPIELPVIAVHYTSDPIPRLSDAVRAGSARYEIEADRVRDKHRRRRSSPAG